MSLKALIGLSLALGVSLFSMFAHAAAETRFLTDMPSAAPMKASDVLKSGKPAYECAKVKIGAHGNAVNVSGQPSKWFAEVPESQDAADAALGENKTAVRCKLKEYSKEKHRMVGVEL